MVKIDTDKSGTVTLSEVTEHLDDPVLASFAKTLDIEILDVKQFFAMLSCNGRKPVDFDSFALGCIKMKGVAKSMDLIDLVYTSKEQVERHREDMARFDAFCRHEFVDLRRLFVHSAPEALDSQASAAEAAPEGRPCAVPECPTWRGARIGNITVEGKY